MLGVCTHSKDAQLDERCASYLLQIRGRGSKFGIDRIHAILQHLGNPHQQLKIIHVAGTNGKGSVCIMLERIFREAGYKTGLYLSPHLVYLGERIQVNRQPLSAQKLNQYTQEFRTWLDPMIASDNEDSPSFFEVMTGMAFHHFAQEKVDVVIVETGLGGRLDATNAVDPLVSVISSIGIDHVEHLGGTHAQIAHEKAGIIKSNKPVVFGWVPEAAEAVIEAIALERKAPLFSTQKIFGEVIENYPQTNLVGDHQRKNAATVTLVAQQLKNTFSNITEEIITRALQDVFVPGCWQMLECADGKTVLCDGAHNEEALWTLDKNLSELRRMHPDKKLIFCVGSTEEYRLPILFTIVAKHAKKIVLMRYHQERAVSINTLRKYIPLGYEGELTTADTHTLFHAPKRCSIGMEGDIIVVTGSYYLVGEVLERMLFQEKNNTVNLQDLF